VRPDAAVAILFSGVETVLGEGATGSVYVRPPVLSRQYSKCVNLGFVPSSTRTDWAILA
jgi:hypothetical protein